jgi:alpha-glucosidase
MIDNHEPAMPTGIQRTWPNLMTQEGVRGQEYNAWDRRGGNPPSHTVTLPFTRGLAGPTDFTPAIFNFSEIVPGTHPHSTLAKQLGEFVVIYSPLQMAADAIENYEGQPALSFIESCPTTWSKTLVPNGEIGQYITVARKERGESGRWFIGSITNETARQIALPLSFLDADTSYRAIIYEDGPQADYETNPYVMTIRQIEVDSRSVLHLNLARSGGAAVRIEKLSY